MNKEVSNLDHADDDTLIHEISDDALESAGDPGSRPALLFICRRRLHDDPRLLPALRRMTGGGPGVAAPAADHSPPDHSIAAQQRRNPGNRPGDAPGVVLAETLQYAPADRLVLEIEVGELLAPSHRPRCSTRRAPRWPRAAEIGGDRSWPDQNITRT